MSNTPNFNLPLLTATQTGKEVTVNQAFMLIDAALQAAGSGQTAATLTAAELSTVLMGPAQLTALIDAELAKLPVPLTSAQLASALAGLPAGVTLAQLQAELAQLPAGSGGGLTLAQLQTELNARPVPATVADVQAAVSTISVGGGSGITLAQLQAEIAKLTPAAFSSSYTKLGVLNNTQTSVTAGAFPGAVYSSVSGKFYVMDNARGFVEYDAATQTATVLSTPLSPAGYKTIAPSLSVLPSGKLLWAGATQNSNVAQKACYTFNANTKAWDTQSFNLVLSMIGAASFNTSKYTMLVGGGGAVLGAQAYDEATGTVTALDGGGFPTSYTVDGTTYNGTTGVKSCSLPSGQGLVLIPASSTVGSACAALKVVVSEDEYGWIFTTATPTSQRFPANSSCMAIAKTSYGAVALVKAVSTGLTKFYKYVEASDSWVPIAEGLGLLSSVTNAVALATGPDDQVLVVTESGSNPGIYLLNAA